MRLPGSIRWRLQLVIVLTTGVSLALACSVFMLLEWRLSLAAASQSALSTGRIAADASSAMLAFGSRAEAEELLAAFRSEPDVRAAALYDSAGRLFAEYRAPDANGGTPATPQMDGLSVENRQMVLFHPVAEGEKRYGTLYLRTDLGYVYAQLWRYGWVALMVFAGALAASFFIGRFLQRTVSGPVLALTRTAQSISKEPDFGVRANLVEGGELELLTTAFNQMLDTIQKQQSQLQAELTERRRAESALRLSEQRYRAIIESQSEMVCRFRPDGTILFVNGGYARAQGTTPEALVGVNLFEFVDEQDRESVRRMLEDIRPEVPEVRIENRFETTEGVRWTLWINRGLDFDDNGRAIELQSTGIDITERKRAEEALKEADQRKDEFLAILAHELRNPLAPLRNALELLRRKSDDRAVIEQARAMMDRQMRQLVRLVDDLLDVSRISMGRLHLRKEPVDLADVLRTAIETARPFIEAPGHELTVTLPSRALPVEVDPTRLAQVVANLLNNAARYTEKGGHIWLTAERQGSEAVVSVRDTGIGIPAEYLSTIFEMFSQVAPVLERSQGGLGIGLSLAKGLVELHGGTLEARSAGSGKGSEFIVHLPIINPPASRVEPRDDRANAGIVRKSRILVVDDLRDAADSLAMMLEMMGHDVRIAYDGLEAVQTAGAFHPNVVLLDIGLPKMNGYEAAHRIREEPWGGNVVLVALTGWGQEEDRRRSMEAGFDHHLTKPVDPVALQKLLALVLAET